MSRETRIRKLAELFDGWKQCGYAKMDLVSDRNGWLLEDGRSAFASPCNQDGLALSAALVDILSDFQISLGPPSCTQIACVAPSLYLGDDTLSDLIRMCIGLYLFL